MRNNTSRRPFAQMLALPVIAVAMAVSLLACSGSGTTSTAANWASSSVSVADSSSTAPVAAAAVTGAGQWQQHSYTDTASGEQLSYNLFLPVDYDPSKSYPLVLFMEDSSMVGTDGTTPLTRGVGATAWASDESQSKTPAIVVAPQYTSVTVGDDYNPTPDLATTVDLVKSLIDQYAVDTDRI